MVYIYTITYIYGPYVSEIGEVSPTDFLLSVLFYVIMFHIYEDIIVVKQISVYRLVHSLYTAVQILYSSFPKKISN